MPKGHPLSERQRGQIYHAYTMGQSKADLAEQYGVKEQSISNILWKQRKRMREEKRQDMAQAEVVVASTDKGRLTCTSTDGRRYTGTHTAPNGKTHRKRFNVSNANEAKEQWRKWCEDIDSECEFMARVERKDVTPVPAPDIEVKPWKDVAEQRQQEIEDLKAELEQAQKQAEYLQGRLDHYEAEDREPTDTDKPVYILWARGDKPRIYGAFRSMERALRKTDELNEVAEFLGNEGAFEVEEVVWRVV